MLTINTLLPNLQYLDVNLAKQEMQTALQQVSIDYAIIDDLMQKIYHDRTTLISTSTVSDVLREYPALMLEEQVCSLFITIPSMYNIVILFFCSEYNYYIIASTRLIINN